MEIVVRLTNLDSRPSIGYIEEVPVTIDNYRMIGTCKIFRDEEGKHFGKLELDEDVSMNLLFYYQSLNTYDHSVYWFSGLNLASEIYRDYKTTTLGEMIVQK